MCCQLFTTKRKIKKIQAVLEIYKLHASADRHAFSNCYSILCKQSCFAFMDKRSICSDYRKQTDGRKPEKIFSGTLEDCKKGLMKANRYFNQNKVSSVGLNH